MAKNSVEDWDYTAANNTDIGGIGIQGTNAPSNFDNALRELMSQTKAGIRVGARTARYAVDSSVSVNNIIITPTPAATTLDDGQEFLIKVAATTTGAASVNISGLGSISLTYMDGTAVSADDIQINDVINIVLRGGAARLIGKYVATVSRRGMVELASPAEVIAGTDTTRAVTPEGHRAGLDSRGLAGHLHGLTISNNATDATNDIDIAAGSCTASDNETLIKLSAGITKRLDAAWSAGTGNGGLDTGSVADGTYHVHAIKNVTSGVCDVVFSTSLSPTLPTGYTKSRRIASIVRASGVIRPFAQQGDRFTWVTPIVERSSADAVTSQVLTLAVPLGIGTYPIFSQLQQQGTAGLVATQFTDSIPNPAPFRSVTITAAAGELDVYNCDGQFYADVNANLVCNVVITSGTLNINVTTTYGYYDLRGRAF